MTELPVVGQVYEFDFQPTKKDEVQVIQLRIVDVTETHVYYKIQESRYSYPMTLELWQKDVKRMRLVTK